MKKLSTSGKSLAQLKKELWIWFSKYIRLRDKGFCIVCGRRASGSGYHASHFIPKSICGLVLYFSEENNHGTCYNCNINLGGNLYLYGKKLGGKKAKELYKIKLETKGVVWGAKDYLEMIEKYKKKAETLQSHIE